MERPPVQPPATAKRARPHRPTSQQAVLDHLKQLKTTSRQLTVCLILLVAAASCLSPYLSLHLNHRVALHLLELDVVQLRSSVISVIICLTFLVGSLLLLRLFKPLKCNQPCRPQRQLKNLLAFSACVSAISYLSLALLVPRIKQVTRMPLASFDCNANLITIENCHQKFSNSESGEQSLLEALHYVLARDLSLSNHERLIKKLNCLQYKDGPQSMEPGRRSLVGTRFLLHDCGLVCKPQRQYLRQFGDDLNAEPADAFQGTSLEGDLFSSQQQVSLKVCFSGEASGSPNSYKQFCITNLASRAQRDLANAQTLTVGQLNEMLRKLIPATPDAGQQQPEPSVDGSSHQSRWSATHKRADEPVQQQATHYVNPIVQFESHFKNWPHLSQPGESLSESTNSSETSGALNAGQWCNFRPIPPFIVNNKPFNEIQCSLEHEYTMSTAGVHSLNIPKDQQIFLKRSGGAGAASVSDETVRKAAQERCSIQCRLNIFYQVDTRQSTKQDNGPLKHYYLPLKPCLIVSKEGNKSDTISYYTLFRSVADASLTLSVIFLALLLLLESMDAKKAPQDSKKHRIVGLLSALAIMPLVVGSAFELSSLYWAPKGAHFSPAYLLSWFQDRLVPSVVEFLDQLGLANKQQVLSRASGSEPSLPTLPGDDDVDLIASKNTEPLVDSYATPFFLYSILMFSLAIVSLSLPSVQLPGSLMRLSSAESLGLSTVSNWNKLKHKSSSAPALTKVHSIDTKQHPNKRLQHSPTILLLLAALFMGYQFNLCHIGETQIMLETFGGPNVNRWSQTQSSSPSSSSSSSSSSHHQNIFTAVWFALSVSSASSLTLLLLALVFSSELSAFFSQFSLFKLTPRQTVEDRQRSNANLIMYLAISLLVYSVRSYILSGLTQSFSLKLFIVLILQAVTTFNLPAIWLALSTRLHEMIAWRSSEGGHLTLKFHLLGEATLALVYFALGRLLALLIHTIHTCLYLHSDDVDWFINTFYQPLASAGPQPKVSHNSTTTNFDDLPNTSQPEISRLFSPLPSERQTYLHASRIFLRYNSLVCLLFGSVLVATFLHLRYHIWAEQRRTLEVSKWASMGVEQASSLERDSCIDERLSADLLRIHSATRHSRRPETQPGHTKSYRHSRKDVQLPRARAKILYRYSVNRGDDQSSESALDEEGPPLETPPESPNGDPSRAASPPAEFRIPIAISEESEDDEEAAPDYSTGEPQTAFQPEEVVERKIVRVRKMVQLVEGDHSHEPTRQPASEPRKRSISFAPTATLITDHRDATGPTSQQYWHSADNLATTRMRTSPGTGPKCASPEPSIDSDDQEYDRQPNVVNGAMDNY